MKVRLRVLYPAVKYFSRIFFPTALQAKLTGLMSPKNIERLTMVANGGRAVRIERIPTDEQIRRGVERLQNDEEYARNQGGDPEDIPQARALRAHVDARLGIEHRRRPPR